jgi:regulator of sirC expression with transglutaminase-like and TPR domain
MTKESGMKALYALISMIDEPDETVYSSVKDQLLKYHEYAMPVLEEAWMAATDLLVVERIEELIEEVNYRFVYNGMVNWLNTRSADLQAVMLLINKLGVSDFKKSDYEKNLEQLFKDAWLEMNENLTALEKIKVLNHIFFSVHKFNAESESNDAVQHFFLSNLMDTKEGNATSTAMLYLSIAQYLKLPVFGVNLPGHLILAFTDDRHALIDLENYGRDDVLFYINPFNGGAVFTENEIDLYINQVKLESKENYYLPATNITIVNRYLKELAKAFRREEQTENFERVNRLLDLFRTVVAQE